MWRTRRGGGEGWVLLLVAVLVLALGAGGLIMWTRVVTERAQEAVERQRHAAASAERSAVDEMRAAERDSGGATEERGAGATEGREADAGLSGATGATGVGRAVELARMIARAVSAADTPGRVEEAKKLVDGAAAELDSGRLKDGPEALSTLRMAIGSGYRSLGDAGKAVAYFQGAADERKARLGERSPDAIRAKMELEDAQRAAGASPRK